MSTERPRGAFGKPKREHIQMPTTTTTQTGQKTVWEYYNERAEIVDKELFRDWNDSLNTLLIFAALFSAILTAFIIESMKLLEEDLAESSRDILLTISRQLANNSLPSYSNSTTELFVPPSFAVRVNSYFFISISCSLIAALGAVLALQWVGSYDAGLTTSSAEDRAMQRQLRYEGVEKWKMGEIISAFPVLLHLALLMFMVGLVDWLWNIHRTVAAIAITGLLAAVTVLGVTTIIGIFDVFSPFRTPISQLVGYAAMMVQYLLRKLIRAPDRLEAPGSFKEREKMQVATLRENASQSGTLWLVKQTEDVPLSRPQFLAVVKEFVNRSMDGATSLILPKSLWMTVFENILRPYNTINDYTNLGDNDITTLMEVARALIYLSPSTRDLSSSILEQFRRISGPQKSWLGLHAEILLMAYPSSWLLMKHYNVVKYAGDLGVSIFDLEKQVLLRVLRLLATQIVSGNKWNISGLCRLLEPLDLRNTQEKHQTVIKDSDILESLMDIADLVATLPKSAESSTICIRTALQYLRGSQKVSRIVHLLKAFPELAISQRRYLYAGLLKRAESGPRNKRSALKLISITLSVQRQPDMAEDPRTLWIDVVKAADKVVSSSSGRYYREGLITLLLDLYPRRAKSILSNPQALNDNTLALLYSIFDLHSDPGLWDKVESLPDIVWKDPTWVRAVEIWFRDSGHINQGFLLPKARLMMSQTIAHAPYRVFGSALKPLLDLIKSNPTEIETVTAIICHPRLMSGDVFDGDRGSLENGNVIISKTLCLIKEAPTLPFRLREARVERYIMTLSKTGSFALVFELLSHCILESHDLTILHWYITLAYIPLHEDIAKKFPVAFNITWTSKHDSEFRHGVDTLINASHAVYNQRLPSMVQGDEEHWQRIFADLEEIEEGAKRRYIAVMKLPARDRFRDPDGLCAQSIL